MFTATIYTLSVISLSGIMDETFAAKEAVRRWNEAGAERTGRLFLLVDDPQAADVLVGIVGNRLEKTELVEECLKNGKHVLLYFNAYSDPKNTIASEQQAVEEFKQAIRARCACAEYNGVPQLSSLLCEQFDKIS